MEGRVFGSGRAELSSIEKRISYIQPNFSEDDLRNYLVRRPCQFTIQDPILTPDISHSYQSYGHPSAIRYSLWVLVQCYHGW
jgi:hypothetical protein